MSDTRKHYREIDSLKGFAIFMVVLGHAIIHFPVDLHQVPWCETLFRMVSGLHMPLFFAISGFCFSFRGSYREFLRKKFRRILLPYYVFNLIALVPRALLPQFVNRPQSVTDSLIDILLYGGEYWFLLTLFLIFTFYPVIYRWQAQSRNRQIAVAAICLVLSLVRIETEVLTLNLISGYLFFFNLGVLLKLNNVRLFGQRLPEGRRLLPAGLALIWLLLLFSPWAGQLEVFVSLLGITVCCFLARLKLFNDLFARFGKFSLQIYLLNGFLLVISRTIICRLTGDPVLIVGFNMLVDFLAAYLGIKYICNRFKLFRVLMGLE